MPVELSVAFIEGSFTLLSTLIATISAALIGKRFHDQKLLQHKLDEAREDIRFLLAVEEEYGLRHKEDRGSSGKISVREFVRDTTNLTFSGNHTPGRVNLNNC